MNPNSKVSHHHDAIVEALAAGEPKEHIARRLGMAPSTLRGYINKNIDPDIIGSKTPHVPDPEVVTREHVLEQRLAEFQSRALKAHALNVQFERVLDEIQAALEPEPVKFQPAQLAPPYEGSSINPHVQAALLSDLHGGEVVDPRSVNGLNEYDWSIMEQRIANWRRSLLSFKAHRPYPIEELQLWFGGDMCGGAHHHELAVTNEYTEAEQAVKMGHLLGDLVESLVPEYPRIVVYEVPGNHGRVPIKPANKQVFNNFDWVSYRIGEAKVAAYESVTWHPNDGNFQVVEIAGLNVLLFHGDGIRSTMPGVPWGGVMRRVAQLKSQYAEQGIYLDGFALGHFHQANAVQNIWMNGSVKGVDEYTLKQFGAGEAPTQLLLWFDPKKQRRTDVSYINP